MTEKKKFRALRGVRDILPPDSSLWNWFEQTARDVFESYNYREIRLPIFEETELFARSVGTETDIVSKEMYVLDLHGSLPLEYAREAIPKYPEEMPKREFEELTRSLIQLLNEALKTDRLDRTPENMAAFEKLVLLYDQLREGRASEWDARSNVGEAIWDTAQDLALGFHVALRPEATASVCRAYIEHNMQQLPQPVRLYYMGPMFRRERPQKGRYRQFYQIGAELLDNVRLVGKITADANREICRDAVTDAEVIEMVMAFFSRLGLEGVRLDINSIGHFAPDCRRGYVKHLREALLRVRDGLGGDSRRRIDSNPLRVLDSKLEHEQPIIEQLPRIPDYLCPDCKTHYAELKRQLELRGVKYSENWRLVRGLDYYMRTTFEITAKGLGSQNAVCGGGRYDDLVRFLGGPPTKGIGFAIGTDRAILSVQESGNLPKLRGLDVFILWMGQAAYPAAARLARRLRGEGFCVELPAEESKLRKALSLADRLGARFAVILGEDEVKSGQFTVKRMADGEQRKLAEAEVAGFVGATKTHN